MKEQDKTPEKKTQNPTETEINDLCNEEFKAIGIKMLTELKKRRDTVKLQQRIRKYKTEQIRAEECNN